MRGVAAGVATTTGAGAGVVTTQGTTNARQHHAHEACDQRHGRPPRCCLDTPSGVCCPIRHEQAWAWQRALGARSDVEGRLALWPPTWHRRRRWCPPLQDSRRDGFNGGAQFGRGAQTVVLAQEAVEAVDEVGGAGSRTQRPS